jgi:lysophospholipase L1-like esterase
MRSRSLLLSLALAGVLGAPARPITVYLAGDSTMAPKRPDRRPETGWGEALQQYFRPEDVRIANHAMNGRSTRTFIAEGRWQAIVDSLAPGDYVFIQFGHNDESVEKTDRYTPPDDYRTNLRRMVADVRARHAQPVLLTPVYRRKFDAQGKLVDTHGVYPGIVRAVAREERVPLIDLHRRTGELLARLGPDSSKALFLQLEPGESPNYPNGVHDNTHFRPLGAEQVARLAVDGIRRAHVGLAAYLRGVPDSVHAASGAGRD